MIGTMFEEKHSSHLYIIVEENTDFIGGGYTVYCIHTANFTKMTKTFVHNLTSEENPYYRVV